jgi:hypothetical protein
MGVEGEPAGDGGAELGSVKVAVHSEKADSPGR